jgi:hypothetical protein
MGSTIEHDERADLPVLENALLWSMRAWTIGLSRGIPVEERIEELFAKLGAPEAAGQLYGFIWIIGHCAARAVEVDCVCNPRVSDHERCLLDVLALTQHGRPAEAEGLLASLVSGQAAAAAAAASARQISQILTASGRFLAPRPLLARDVRPRSGAAVPSRRPITVH